MAEILKKDRGDKSQESYGLSLGLSQSQVSRLERKEIKRLPWEVVQKLEARFGSLPRTVHEVGTPLATGSQVAPPSPSMAPDEVQAHVQLSKLFRRTEGKGEVWSALRLFFQTYSKLSPREERMIREGRLWWSEQLLESRDRERSDENLSL